MEIVLIVMFFVIGLFFGSFFCVVGMRLGRNEDFIKGRSYCDSCHHSLSFLDMIPIFSYLFLRGRCRYCKQKVSPFSTFIELFTGILFAVSYYSFGFSFDLLIALLASSLFLIVLTSDLLYMIIPDSVLLFFAICFSCCTFFSRRFFSSCLFSFLGCCSFSFYVLFDETRQFSF